MLGKAACATAIRRIFCIFKRSANDFMQNRTDQNLCLVCGYGMDDPPRDYNVCPSCGTEYGVNDVNASYEELRKAWIRTGPKWWSKTDPEPENWSPSFQLASLGPIFAEVYTTTTSSPQVLSAAHVLMSGTDNQVSP